MCGIVGAVSERNITSILIEGLRRLEYRGYDSAGIAVIDKSGHLKRLRVLGKVQALTDAALETGIAGKIGIAHTRWATHGKPSEKNAHPHVSHNQIAVVHNGIIENYEHLRKKLIELDYTFDSETDTEVAAHLIHYYFEQHGQLLKAVFDAASDMKGAFALGVMHEKHPDELVAIKKGSPLVVGLGIGERLIASDALALRSFAQSIIYLEEGDCAHITAHRVTIYNDRRQEVTRPSHALPADTQTITKEPYRHYMQKEIFEQPAVFASTLSGRLTDLHTLKASFGDDILTLFSQVKHIHIVACGTSYHAAMMARYWFESLTTIPVLVEIASEYRYKENIVLPQTLLIAVSQSGETADLLAAVQKAKSLNYLATYAICNVATSHLVRECTGNFLTRAGVEIGVASTKAFTSQLVAFLMIAAVFCQDERAELILTELKTLPEQCEQILTLAPHIEMISKQLSNKTNALFLGRGIYYPLALEGALKLKEISYIHAEGYPAGELKHGPLALVDKQMPVIALAPPSALLEKLKSNLQEVSARGGQLYLITEASTNMTNMGQAEITLPPSTPWIAPILYSIPLQLLAYYVAVSKGTDVDQPRNLAKSVTVE